MSGQLSGVLLALRDQLSGVLLALRDHVPLFSAQIATRMVALFGWPGDRYCCGPQQGNGTPAKPGCHKRKHDSHNQIVCDEDGSDYSWHDRPEEPKQPMMPSLRRDVRLAALPSTLVMRVARDGTRPPIDGGQQTSRDTPSTRPNYW